MVGRHLGLLQPDCALRLNALKQPLTFGLGPAVTGPRHIGMQQHALAAGHAACGGAGARPGSAARPCRWSS